MSRPSMLTLLLLLLPLAVGCTAVDRALKTSGPDGSEHLLVSCFSVASCYSDARNACGGTYQLINTTAETSSVFSGEVGTRTTMLIKCS